MSRTLRAIYVCAFGVLAPEWLTVAQAQSLSPEGAEYTWPAPLPGDQVHPALDLSAEGGWAVWIDNSISPLGPGVAATRLDANGRGGGEILQAGVPETPGRSGRRGGRNRNRNRGRNNGSIPAGDLAHPNVARLPHGGAAITWQAGPVGRTEAFVRFVDAEGQFAGDAIQLSSGAQDFRETERVSQMSWRRNRLRNTRWRIRTDASHVRDRGRDAHPVALSDGGTLVVYSGIRQARTNTFEIVTEVTTRTRRGSTSLNTNDVLREVSTVMDWKQDIFLKRFGPDFESAGEEIVVNQMALNGQRSPDAAVLADGRIVVVWVSEDHVPALPTDSAEIGVHARLFDASGEPLGDQFQINGVLGVCARPVVAGSPDGGFTVAWNQRDGIRNNGWDVIARSFGADGQPVGDGALVNERTFGDQFAPSIAAAGLNHLIVWSSLGQDGSGEGIYGRLFSAGTPAGSEIRVNTSTDGNQVHPYVASNGSDRFFAVWAHYAGETRYDLMGQIYRAAPPPVAPAAPLVLAVSASDLLVTWDPVSGPGLTGYELYMDGSANPIPVAGTSHEVHGLEAESEHTFRLAYRRLNGERSLLSEPVSGMTLAVPGAINEPVDEGIAGNDTTTSQPPLAGIGAGTSAPLGLEVEARDGRIVLTWNTIAGKDYQVRLSYDFTRWFDWGEPRRAAGGSDSVTLEPKERAVFFRVLELP